MTTGERFWTLSLPVLSMTISSDGKTLATGCSDGSIRLLDLPTKTERFRFSGGACETHAIALSPDGKFLASAYGGHDAWTLRLLDLSTGKEIFHLGQERHEVWDVAFSPDSKLLIAVSYYEGKIYIWEIPSCREIELPATKEFGLREAAFSADGKTLIFAGEGKTVHLWDIPARRERASFKTPFPVYSLALHPDGRSIATGGGFYGFGAVHFWDMVTGKQIAEIARHEGNVTEVAFVHDGQVLVTGGTDRSVRLWKTSSGAPLFRIDVRLDLEIDGEAGVFLHG
ncbi:MAG: WD40 repeat domain-containing protein [Verrucomicrobia bacterium]|nr:WD40 repeat domain-containing protein [Verrucomicrobiota bacterium]